MFFKNLLFVAVLIATSAMLNFLILSPNTLEKETFKLSYQDDFEQYAALFLEDN